MQLVEISSARPNPEDEVRQFERLVATLSSKFAALQMGELSAAFAQTLEQICLDLNVDRATLVEFAEADSHAVRACHGYNRPGQNSLEVAPDPADWHWLLDQVRSHRVVAITRVDDLPMAARGEREYARRSHLSSSLSVAVTIGGGCIGALVLASFQRFREWPAVVQDRARLIAEIIGGALQRSRQEAALRASLAEIERLNRRLIAENVCLKEDIQTFHDFEEIVGESAVMRDALERLCQVAPLNCSVLLQGETGTGKELFARALHERSRRRSHALVRVNCAALPPTLVESELFGHEKGSFTGAICMRQGRFELADGGTIFLDEIGDLPYEMQGKLLRVLQEGEFERVGSSRTRRVDVRVIAATHHNLEEAVAEGHFRPDLYYRLGVFPIHVPALRERRDDIAPLMWFFIQRHQRELGRRITKVPQQVLDQLLGHDWPGNVRELDNVVERAMIRSTDGTLQLDGAIAAKPRERFAGSGTLDDIQRSHIEATLRQCGWRINGIGNAAECLGMHPNTLRFRMKKLRILSPREQRLAGL
jgi:transcriptional regulator with GAF, ATPase, and Fis domain